MVALHGLCVGKVMAVLELGRGRTTGGRHVGCVTVAAAEAVVYVVALLCFPTLHLIHAVF